MRARIGSQVIFNPKRTPTPTTKGASLHLNPDYLDGEDAYRALLDLKRRLCDSLQHSVKLKPDFRNSADTVQIHP